MPNKSSIADFIVSWEKLVTNVANNAADLPPHVQIYSQPLEGLLESVRLISASKDTRRGVKQQEVKEAEELMRRGRDLAGKLKSVLLAHYGRTSELLLGYGIMPRRFKKTRPGEPENPQPEDQAPEAGGQSKSATQETEGKEDPKVSEEPKPEDPAPASQS